MNLLFDDVDIFEDDFDILEIIDIGFPRSAVLDLLIFTIWMNLHSIENFD
jgi:hypothetical protein